MDAGQLQLIIVVGGLIVGVLLISTWYEVHQAAVEARKYFRRENARHGDDQSA